MYSYPGSNQNNSNNNSQAQNNFAVIPPNIQPAQNKNINHQYAYNPSNQNIKFETVTPTPDMVQPQPQFNFYEGEQMPNPSILENEVLNNRPLSPLLMYNSNGSTFSMPVRNVQIKSELHVATAFVRMKITFINTSNARVNALFVLPTKGTVTSCAVNFDNGSRFLDTTFVDSAEAGKFSSRKKTNEENPIDSFIPDVFRLPIAKIKPNESITIEVDYMQNLEFQQCRYHFIIPLKFNPALLPSNVNLSSIINIECTINCVADGMNYGSSSHQLILVEQQNMRSKLIAQPYDAQAVNFHLSYAFQTNVISAALINEPSSEYAYDAKGSFACFVNPPALHQSIIARDIIFLLDRSGSMTGTPYRDAVKGLEFALDTLCEQDRFTIIAFDHEQEIFNPHSQNNFQNEVRHNSQQQQLMLYPSSSNMIQEAKNFLQRTPARGATDIRTPLLQACELLNRDINYSYNGMNNNCSRIPFVVLLTDGAVQDEKEIVAEMQNLSKNVRILTFGIGQYCNWYFLKMLSLMSRGWNDGCIYTEDLYTKMQTMMDRASTPILTNVELVFPASVDQLEIYPQTIPDLFVGGPIVIAGKYKGFLPNEVQLRGKLGNGEELVLQITIERSDVIPVSRVFLKQRIDQLTSGYWLNGNNEIRKQIVDISVNESFPSAYTSMVAYELTPKEKAEIEAENSNQKKSSVSKGKGRGLSTAQVAGLAGGAIVIGAGAFLLFGNVGATMGNIGIPSFGTGVFDAIGNVDCPCDSCMDMLSCGACDCGGIASIFSCGGCADCDQCLDAIPCGDCDGGCIELPGCGCCANVGDFFGDIGSGICGSCGGIGDCMGDISGFCGNCFGNVTGVCENMGECIGGICGIFGDMDDCLGDIVGNFGECCGAIGEIVGEIF